MVQRLERVALAVISAKLWRRYVDGTFLFIKENKFSTFHQLLNTTIPGITITMKTPAENTEPVHPLLLPTTTLTFQHGESFLVSKMP